MHHERETSSPRDHWTRNLIFAPAVPLTIPPGHDCPCLPLSCPLVSLLPLRGGFDAQRAKLTTGQRQGNKPRSARQLLCKARSSSRLLLAASGSERPRAGTVALPTTGAAAGLIRQGRLPGATYRIIIGWIPLLCRLVRPLGSRNVGLQLQRRLAQV